MLAFETADLLQRMYAALPIFIASIAAPFLGRGKASASYAGSGFAGF
jgi:hypothetical protein